MVFKKTKKKVFGLATLGITTGASSIALGALGSTQGQKGLANVSRFFPATGSLLGAGLLLGSVKKLKKLK